MYYMVNHIDVRCVMQISTFFDHMNMKIYRVTSIENMEFDENVIWYFQINMYHSFDWRDPKILTEEFAMINWYLNSYF